MRLVALAILGVTTFLTSQTAAAQESPVSFAERGPQFLLAATPVPKRLDVSRTPLLRQRITLDLRDVSMHEALATIGRQSGLQLMYRDQLLPATRNVTLRAEAITVAAALTEVLLDAGVDILFSSSGNAALIRRGAPGQATQVGVIVGRITDSTSGLSIAGVALTVDGTRLSITSGAEGRYTLRGVPIGNQSITARKLGFRSVSRSVEVSDTATATADFALARTPTMLREVVSTATGDRERLEIGNAIGTIRADSVVRTTLIRNLSDLLQARTPGLVVANTSGLVGSPSRIRIRGVNSVFLNNDPIIVIDGVRHVSQTTVAESQTNIGGVNTLTPASYSGNLAKRNLTPSRLDDIDPNIIESIDILRGPSAASLYGTEAANGVIVIKTKQGRAGDWRLNVLGDQGWSHIPDGLPDQWAGWGTQFDGRTVHDCTLSRLSSGGRNAEDGSCVLDSLTHFHPQNHTRTRTLSTGTNQTVSVSLSGGTERLRQFLSLRLADNLGMAKMSDVERDRIAASWGSAPPSWMVRPNSEKDISGSSRTNVNVNDKLNFAVTTLLTYRDVLNGGGGLDVSLFPASGGRPIMTLGDTLRYLVAETQRARQTSGVKRGGVSINSNYAPLSWLQLRGTVGGDYTLRQDESLLRASDCTPFLAQTQAIFACRSGRAQNRGEVFVTTVDVGAHATFAPRPWLTTRTAFGEQYTNTRFKGLNVGNSAETNLGFGSDLLTPAPVPTTGEPQLFDVSESRDEAATAGWYLEEHLAFNDRLFVTGAVRQDAASAFGASVNASAPVYPKVGASWLISDEVFFPRQPWISTLRLRTAYGHSGNQASRRHTVNNYQLAQAIVEGATVSSVQVIQIGNQELRPERSTEWEGGLDVSLLRNERVRAELTMYRKLSKDAIISVALPSSYGLGFFTTFGGLQTNLSQAVNVGSVENRGFEISTTARLLDSPKYGWELTVNWARNRNRLVKKDPRFGQFGPDGTQFREGYPLYGYWGFPVTSYADLDGDGILRSTEIAFAPRAFMGAPFPRQQLTYANAFSLVGGMVRLGANVDHTIGLANNRITDTPRCRVDPTCSVAQQAAASQAELQGGFIGESSTLRVAELSATYNVPVSLASRYLRAQSVSFTLAGRNLGLWTSYAGKDPNVDTSGALGDATADHGWGVPQPRMWTLRLNLGL